MGLPRSQPARRSPSATSRSLDSRRAVARRRASQPVRRRDRDGRLCSPWLPKSSHAEAAKPMAASGSCARILAVASWSSGGEAGSSRQRSRTARASDTGENGKSVPNSSCRHSGTPLRRSAPHEAAADARSSRTRRRRPRGLPHDGERLVNPWVAEVRDHDRHLGEADRDVVDLTRQCVSEHRTTYKVVPWCHMIGSPRAAISSYSRSASGPAGSKP